MGSLNSIKCTCQCGPKTEENSAINCERKKGIEEFEKDLEIDQINMLLESTENRNSIIVNNKYQSKHSLFFQNENLSKEADEINNEPNLIKQINDLDEFISDKNLADNSEVNSKQLKMGSNSINIPQPTTPKSKKNVEFAANTNANYEQLATGILQMRSSHEITTGRLSKRKSNYVKLVKKINPFIKDTLELWRDMKITDIIPESKLMKMGDNDIVYCGQLYKYIQDENNMNGAYTPAFAIFTKCELCLYKTRETFLRKLKPLYVIPIFCIKSVIRLSVQENYKNKNYNHLLLEFTPEFELKISTLKKNKLYKSMPDVITETVNTKMSMRESSPNTRRLNADSFATELRNKKISFIEDSYKPNLHVTEFKNEEEQTTINFILLGSKDEKLANNWTCVINYFITQ